MSESLLGGIRYYMLPWAWATIRLAFSTSLMVRPRESRILRKTIPAGNISMLLACRERLREAALLCGGWATLAQITIAIKRRQVGDRSADHCRQSGRHPGIHPVSIVLWVKTACAPCLIALIPSSGQGFQLYCSVFVTAANFHFADVKLVKQSARYNHRKIN